MNETKMDLSTAVGHNLTEDGVTTITQGVVLCAKIREELRQVIKTFDPEGYAAYRSIKYPTGGESFTAETGRAATKFLFERAATLLVPHYLTTKTPGE